MRIGFSATSRELAGDPLGVKPRDLEVCGHILYPGDMYESMFAGRHATFHRILCEGLEVLLRLVESIPIAGVPPFEIQLRGREAIVRRLFGGTPKGVDDVLRLLPSSFGKSSSTLDRRDCRFSVGAEGNVDLRERNAAFTVLLQGGGEPGLGKGVVWICRQGFTVSVLSFPVFREAMQRGSQIAQSVSVIWFKVGSPSESVRCFLDTI